MIFDIILYVNPKHTHTMKHHVWYKVMTMQGMVYRSGRMIIEAPSFEEARRIVRRDLEKKYVGFIVKV